MELVLTFLAFVGVGLGCLYMAWTTFRRGGAQMDDLGGVQRFRAGGCRATLSALAFASFGVGALAASVLLAREALAPPAPEPAPAPLDPATIEAETGASVTPERAVVEPSAHFDPQALTICTEPSESPLAFICKLGRPAAEVELGCAAPQILMGCRARLPSLSGHSCPPAGDAEPLMIAFVGWTAGTLHEQSYEGPVAGISARWHIDDAADRAQRWRRDREQLIQSGCESVEWVEGKREHLTCGPDWEATIVDGVGYTVQFGTTEFFDCVYSGQHAEADRPSRALW